MKRDLNWVKINVRKELDSWRNVEGGIDGDGINEVLNIINQLDGPEDSKNSFYWFTAKKRPPAHIVYSNRDNQFYGFNEVPQYKFIEHHDLRFVTNCPLDDLIEQYK